MNYAQVIDTMFKLTVAMAVGFGLNKLKVIGAETNKSLSGMIINVTCPALVVYAVCNQKELSAEVVKLLGFGVALYLLLPLLVVVVTLLLGAKADKRGVYQMLLMFGNITFMGFPVVQAMYGEQAIFYINILNILFAVFIFTYGVGLLKENGPGGRFRLRVKDLFSPGAISGYLSLAIYFFRIPVPSLLVNAMGFVGGVTTPLSMIVIGSIIAEFPFKALFSQVRLFGLAAVKLLVFPLLGFLVASLVFEDPMLVGIVTVSLGMPSASLCVMVCKQYGSDTQAETAALGVFITTVLSIVTIPLVIFLLGKA